MINLLKKTWWKYIAVVILLYVIIGGMLVPLGPGIKSVYPLTFSSDTTVDFTLTGFNTHFQDAKDVQVWFKMVLISTAQTRRKRSSIAR